ncbi:MAG TPA: protein BatD [Firmicutes bacterium]|nr:protein BatD [Bacillota bacterium]
MSIRCCLTSLPAALAIAVVALILLILFAAPPATFAAQEDIRLEVSLDRDTIGIAEQAYLQVKVTGTIQNLPDPHLPSLPMFQLYQQGRSMSFQSVNGVMSSSVTHRFALVPSRAGTFPIDDISVVYNNKRYKGNRVELTVVDRSTAAPEEVEIQARDNTGQSKDYFLEAVVDNGTPYVNEQITFTLKFYIAVQHFGSPELTEPATTGFWTEVLGNESPYYQTINGRRYKVIERKYALYPTQTGELTIGRALIRVTVASRQSRSRDPFDAFGGFFGRGETVSVSSKPLKVNVQPLPNAGRPADFSGTIGRYSITATADKTEVEVNQPVTVKIEIRGVGNIKAIAEPTIPDLPDFRIYQASVDESINRVKDKLGGTRIFEEVFIPRRPGLLEIPPIEYTCFDPEESRYRRISTKPITINVTRPEGYAESSEIPYGSPGQTLGSDARDIRYIAQDIGNVKPSGQLVLFTPLYLIVNGLPVVVLVGLVIIRRRREKLAADTGLARSRGATRVARKHLARARSLISPGKAVEFYAEIYRAVTSYIADKLNISPHGLTTTRIAELLAERGADQQTINQTNDLLNKCDFARFAPASVTDDDIRQSLKAAEVLITRMEGLRFD